MTGVLVCLPVMLLLGWLVPHWWWIMIVPFVYGAAGARTAGKAVLTGFASSGILWLGASLVLFLSGSEVVAARVAGMFGLGGPWTMIAATALIAAVAGAASGFAGHSTGALFRKP